MKDLSDKKEYQTRRSHSMKLENQIALITGAGRDGKGIGRAIALCLAAEGADIVIVDYGIDSALAVAKEVEAIGRRALAVQCDVVSVAGVNEAVRLALEHFVQIDVLVNNAGIVRDSVLLRMSESDWDDVIDANLKGTFNFTKAVAKHMYRRRSGNIVNIASVMGLIGNAGQANYSASKGAVIALTKTTAKELGQKGIRVNAVAPGLIDTKMTEEIPAENIRNIIDHLPLSRQGTPEDVAKAVLFFCSEDSSYITGQVLQVDGGMVM